MGQLNGAPNALVKKERDAFRRRSLEAGSKQWVRGQKVSWKKSDGDIGEGEIGKVVGANHKQIGVEFRKGTWYFPPEELTKVADAEESDSDDDDELSVHDGESVRTCLCTCLDTCLCTCLGTCPCTCLDTCLCTCLGTYLSVYMFGNMPGTHIWTQVHTRVYMTLWQDNGVLTGLCLSVCTCLHARVLATHISFSLTDGRCSHSFAGPRECRSSSNAAHEGGDGTGLVRCHPRSQRAQHHARLADIHRVRHIPQCSSAATCRAPVVLQSF